MHPLTVIIVSFNTKEQTLRAVKSALALTYKPTRVIVVDNHSHDGSVEVLKELAHAQSRVTLKELPENLGFSAGNNVALQEVKDGYAFLLNSDAYFSSPDDVSTLITYMQEHPDVGLLTPRVTLGSSSILDPAAHRGFPTPWNAFCYYSGLEHLFPGIEACSGYHQLWKDMSTIHEVDACTGAAMLIPASVLVKVGLFDEQFFMYGEDLDLCFRIKQAGYQIIYHPDATVIHDKHSSGLKKTKTAKSTQNQAIESKTKFAFYDAMKLFYRKHYARVYPAIVYSLTMMGIDALKWIKSR